LQFFPREARKITEKLNFRLEKVIIETCCTLVKASTPTSRAKFLSKFQYPCLYVVRLCRLSIPSFPNSNNSSCCLCRFFWESLLKSICSSREDSIICSLLEWCDLRIIYRSIEYSKPWRIWECYHRHILQVRQEKFWFLIDYYNRNFDFNNRMILEWSNSIWGLINLFMDWIVCLKLKKIENRFKFRNCCFNKSLRMMQFSL